MRETEPVKKDKIVQNTNKTCKKCDNCENDNCEYRELSYRLTYVTRD